MSLFPLFETIAINNGKIQNIEFHQERFNHACRNYFNIEPYLNLKQVINISDEIKIGLYRAKIEYNNQTFCIKIHPYKTKKITEFKLYFTQNIEYQFKYSQRDFFNQIPLTENEEAIIINNGKVSDATIGNLLFLKNGKWFSPKHYLLKGTQLSYLLTQKRVELIDITFEQLIQFEKIMLINALNPFDLQRALPIQAIKMGKISTI